MSTVRPPRRFLDSALARIGAGIAVSAVASRSSTDPRSSTTGSGRDASSSPNRRCIRERAAVEAREPSSTHGKSSAVRNVRSYVRERAMATARCLNDAGEWDLDVTFPPIRAPGIARIEVTCHYRPLFALIVDAVGGHAELRLHTVATMRFE